MLRKIFYKKQRNEAPPLKVVWNTDKNDFYRSFDGINMECINETYPEGFSIGEVDPDIIYNNLVSASKIYNIDDLWRTADNSKVLGVLEHWYRNQKLTPPILDVYENKLVLIGGNNRFNVARLYSGEDILFITSINNKMEISNILNNNVKWM